ncbi:Thioredoxin-like protein [Tripterygium wilfordii]|uniref:Thioredoxin-like protein HCF164, chloroplastic n=1 Tax=Tripterygium wilfordii TaxID=458696 RepID=A0A7J7CQE5_TRIWF|nr:thioredoxin-like protein HCF164, chloroplastic [Tripterygium wilfordii]XP_038723623.1 thioredoxin-like protein HCF164, chloroplastic [Tripterygium wilfordii]KAF5736096.1 Thioredoxin-like protein [Tripterygium wilfordii]
MVSAMARVLASNALGVHRLSPCSYFQTSRLPPAPSLVKTYGNLRRGFQGVACQTEPPTETSTTSEKDSDQDASTSSSVDSGLPEFPNKSLNKQIAVISTLAAVGLFLSTRLDFGVSLKDLSAAALPYEEALSNGKPTVVEFYADWCEVCRELAPDIYSVEQQYKDRVNFVMLNVDNTKWEQELDEFGVEGIPHIAFLDKDGNEEGNVVGKLPKQFFLENVDALARGEESIPHARIVGQYSRAESRKVRPVVDPRSHG